MKIKCGENSLNFLSSAKKILVLELCSEVNVYKLLRPVVSIIQKLVLQKLGDKNNM